MRRFGALVAITVLLLFVSSELIAATATPDEVHRIGMEAYVYFYPLLILSMREPPHSATDSDGPQGEGHGQDGVEKKIYGRTEAQEVRGRMVKPPKHRRKEQNCFERNNRQGSEHVASRFRTCG
ncbi:MAG TPA: hypothetical protein VH640_15625 [Bryobacteraceae bacterium]|jgi:hypothetical protein